MIHLEDPLVATIVEAAGEIVVGRLVIRRWLVGQRIVGRERQADRAQVAGRDDVPGKRLARARGQVSGGRIVDRLECPGSW